MKHIPLFLETIKVKDGHFYNLPFHLHRMKTTLQHFCVKVSVFSIQDNDIPKNKRNGLVKCRIIYSENYFEIQYAPYVFKEICTLKVIEDDSLVYNFKFYDRSSLNNLFAQKETADDILIIQNGLVTDTSFSNVVFQDSSGKLYTPTSCILAGTKRKKLIKEGKIQETEIKESNIFNYEKIFLINSMIDLEDALYITPQNLI